MDSPVFEISFEDAYRFDASPEDLWRALGRTDLYSSWWRWMRQVEVTGDMPERDASVSFRVFAPIPYRMRLRVEVADAERPRRIEARIGGDLTGRGRLAFEPSADGTIAHVGWDVHVANRALRSLIHVTRPLLIRAQIWAVHVALRGFRRYLERQ